MYTIKIDVERVLLPLMRHVNLAVEYESTEFIFYEEDGKIIELCLVNGDFQRSERSPEYLLEVLVHCTSAEFRAP